jgi:hypothetical protein
MRFSIRDLLWATVAIALCVGWWMDNQTKHAAVGQAHRLHYSLDLARKWHGYYSSSKILTIRMVPTTPPDWTPLDEPLVEP